MITYKQADRTYLKQYDSIPMRINVASYYKLGKLKRGLGGFMLYGGCGSCCEAKKPKSEKGAARSAGTDYLSRTFRKLAGKIQFIYARD